MSKVGLGNLIRLPSEVSMSFSQSLFCVLTYTSKGYHIDFMSGIPESPPPSPHTYFLKWPKCTCRSAQSAQYKFFKKNKFSGFYLYRNCQEIICGIYWAQYSYSWNSIQQYLTSISIHIHLHTLAQSGTIHAE